MENLEEKAKNLIGKIPYITIASITPQGRPWNSPVFAVHDDKYNFVWNSSFESQHSRNISSDKNIFIVIYDSNVGAGQGFGIYIEAEAKELNTTEELEYALKLFFGNNSHTLNDFLQPSPRRMYIAIPKKIWVNQYKKGHIPPDWKVEIKLY